MVYERTLNESKIIVLFNVTNARQDFELPDGSYTNLLTGKKINRPVLGLNALESAILKLN